MPVKQQTGGQPRQEAEAEGQGGVPGAGGEGDAAPRTGSGRPDMKRCDDLTSRGWIITSRDSAP
ncbi:hypothetical protein GCM10027261_16530 [Geodermatophilus arenarius]